MRAILVLALLALAGCAGDIGPSPAETTAAPHHDNPRGETWMGRRQ